MANIPTWAKVAGGVGAAYLLYRFIEKKGGLKGLGQYVSQGGSCPSNMTKFVDAQGNTYCATRAQLLQIKVINQALRVACRGAGGTLSPSTGMTPSGGSQQCNLPNGMVALSPSDVQGMQSQQSNYGYGYQQYPYGYQQTPYGYPSNTYAYPQTPYSYTQYQQPYSPYQQQYSPYQQYPLATSEYGYAPGYQAQAYPAAYQASTPAYNYGPAPEVDDISAYESSF